MFTHKDVKLLRLFKQGQSFKKVPFLKSLSKFNLEFVNLNVVFRYTRNTSSFLSGFLSFLLLQPATYFQGPESSSNFCLIIKASLFLDYQPLPHSYPFLHPLILIPMLFILVAS